jgi:hypothetical protein
MKSRGIIAVGGLVLAACALSGCGGHSYRRAARSGIRLGYAAYGGFEIRELDGRPTVGLYVRPKSSFPAVVEVGVDYLPDPNEPSDRILISAHGGLLYFPSRTRSLYVELGGGGMHETYADVENTAGFAEAGVGYRTKFKALGSELDARLVYQALIGSNNASDVVRATVGLSF